MKKREFGHWFDVFIEYLIAGIATALGELIVSRLFKWFKKRRQKNANKDSTSRLR